MRLLLSALLATCLLTACARSTPFVKVELPELPATLTTCPALQSVSGRIGAAETVGDDRVLVMWAQDRTVAVQCRRRLEALVSVYEEMRADLARKQPEK